MAQDNNNFKPTAGEMALLRAIENEIRKEKAAEFVFNLRMQMLMPRVDRMVGAYIGKFHMPTKAYREELQSDLRIAGYTALTEAMRKYKGQVDDEGNLIATEWTYAYRWVKGAITREHHRIAVKHETGAYGRGETYGQLGRRDDAALGVDGEDFDEEGETANISYIESYHIDEAGEERRMLSEWWHDLKRCMHLLTDREREFVALTFNKSLTQSECAVEMGISKQRVNNIKASIVAKLAPYLGKDI